VGFFDLSLETADKFSSWGLRLSLCGAVVTALGVFLLMWGTRIKDQDFDEQIAILHSRAATSEERAAVLEKEAAELRLGGGQSARKDEHAQSGARQLTAEQRNCLAGRLAEFKSPVALRFEQDQEAAEYAASLRDVLLKGGVPVSFTSAAKSAFTGVRLAMTNAEGGDPQPASSQMLSILQYCGIALDPPIPWQQFPRAAGDQHNAVTPSAHPDQVLLFVGAKPPGR
jgi:hypothetical protein